MEQKISKGQAEIVDIVMPGQTNHYGTLFGGVLLAQMDKAANLAATRYCSADCVTVSVDNITFSKPVKLGEATIVSARVIYVGNSSLVVRVKADSETQAGERKSIIDCANFVFVSIGKSGKPQTVPTPIIETDQEKKLFDRGREIKENLKRLC